MSQQQNNNDSSGLALAGGVFIAMAVVMMVFIFMALAFLAFVFTILALFAWNKPLNILKGTIYPDEAQAFVKRGLAGAVLLPVFVLFCVILTGVPLVPDYWVWTVIGGYVAGSVGIEILNADQHGPAGQSVVMPPEHQAQQPSANTAPPAPPFHFASWNDEDRTP